MEICLGKGRKDYGKRRKCFLPAFSPFPKMSLEAFFPWVLESQDCVVKDCVDNSPSSKELSKHIPSTSEKGVTPTKQCLTNLWPW